ncbi:MAG: hypothetical protein AAFV51_14890, partial [Pseudomonadota bacterium]
MASVFGGTLATGDQVNLVAGVAQGLVLPDATSDEPILLPDILGIECDPWASAAGGDDDAGVSVFALDVKRIGRSPAITADGVAIGMSRASTSSTSRCRPASVAATLA